MSKVLATLLIVLLGVGTAFSQSVGRTQSKWVDLLLAKKVTYTASTDDTTNWIRLPATSELILFFQSTDSIEVDVTVDGAFSGVLNDTVPNGRTIPVTFADSVGVTDDSISSGSNNGCLRYSVVRSSTLDRLPGGVDLIRFQRLYRASGQGTTTGREFRIWARYRDP